MFFIFSIFVNPITWHELEWFYNRAQIHTPMITHDYTYSISSKSAEKQRLGRRCAKHVNKREDVSNISIRMHMNVYTCI